MTDVTQSDLLGIETRSQPGAPVPRHDPQAIFVAPGSADRLLADLPRIMRLGLDYVSLIRKGTLELTLPDGRRVRTGGQEDGPAAQMHIRDYNCVTRVMNSGDIGIAEAYLQGEWDTPDLTRFLYIFCINHELISSMLGDRPVMRFAQVVWHWLHRNTRSQAKRNITAHYDLGNAFYASWLDRTMTYSSALYEDETVDLAAAQTAKYRQLAEGIALQDGQSLLEIGCGWGGFAEYAARHHGAKVTGLTISPSQAEYARKRIHEAGLAERVEIRLQDYRDETGIYDRIASIEMIEAVGEKYWPRYFAQLRDRLRPSGLAGIQAITIQDKFFASYRREVDFIQRYVFPGGMLPSPGKLAALGETFGIPIIRQHIFGKDYARTLAEWRDRFRAAWPTLTPLGFDERFRRIWEYYLAYCEAGFLSGNIDVRQIVFAKTP